MRCRVAPRLALASLLSATALSCAGTAAPTVASGASGESPTERREAERGSDAEGFEPPARPEPAPDLLLPGTCDTTTAEAIAATVSAQLEAFTREDIAAAYGLTSPFFQRVLDVEAFATMIRTDYPYLLESSGHRLDECWVRGRRGYILAGVRSGSRETVLRYDVSEEPGLGWRIDGAAALPGISLPPDRLV
jgi:hypothetical protein